jgi:trigger factor
MGMQSANLQVEMFTAEAERRVKLGLLVAEVAKEAKLTPSEAKMDEKLTEMAQSYGESSQQMIDYYKGDAKRMQHIEQLVVEKMAEDLILQQANVKVVKKTFEEITQQ